MGTAAPVVSPVKLRAGIWRSIAIARLPAGTAGTEYQVLVPCPLRGSPKLSSQRKLDGMPLTSNEQAIRAILLCKGLIRAAAPGSPGSDPQTLRVSESNAVLKGALSGMGSGFCWQKKSFRPIASL